MIYESSYESGRIPFVPDLNRGHWSKTSDFVFATLGLAYRSDILLLFRQVSDKVSVTSLLPALAISLALYTVPLLMIQSFMGQFSSSGFISSFRISPIFKGIGYVSLVLNVFVLIFHSLFAMIPLVYLIASFKPELPWSCDGVYSWVDFCNKEPGSLAQQDYFDFTHFFEVPSNSYFVTLFRKTNFLGLQLKLSWHLVISAICIWIIITVMTYKLKSISQTGQIVRFSVSTVVVLLLLLIVRLSFVPEIGKVFSDIITPNWHAFGSGWGLILTLASFNKFNTNIRHTSWLIGGSHIVMIILYSILEMLIMGSVLLLTHEEFQGESKPYLILFLNGGSVFASMKWANLWSILFYFMLLLAGITTMIVQLNIILYSMFDEFISLRKNRTKVSLSLVGVMAICSLYFATEHGYMNYWFLKFDTLITQSLIDLLVILAVLWVYGRQRFQRDLEFMINERFANWKIFIIRFLVPMVLLIALMEGILVSFFVSFFGETSITVFNFLLRPLPWLCVPGYAIYCLLKSKGSFTERFAKSSRPTDWYPVAAEDRHKYEELVNINNMTHPLNPLEDDDYD